MLEASGATGGAVLYMRVEWPCREPSPAVLRSEGVVERRVRAEVDLILVRGLKFCEWEIWSIPFNYGEG